jgi:diketogulonate reductase-like aldo/keto reductase
MLTGTTCTEAVAKAIETGYRFIDTAQYYENEKEVGAAIAASGMRDDLFVATKVWVDRLGYKDVLKSTNVSLKKLGLKSVDLLYVHWPSPPNYKPEETLRAFCELVDLELVRNIGVSNFTPALIDEAIAVCEGYGKAIMAVQVEHHPLLQQREMREYLNGKDMDLVAYSPLARRRALDVPELVQVAEKHGVSTGQVSLAWIIAHGAIPIPKSAKPEHIEDNFKAQDLALDADDIALIDSIGNERRIIDPEGIAPEW